jgi:hypothetical protein
VDNEDSILIGMNSLLTRWGCQVWTATNQANAPHCWQKAYARNWRWWTTTWTTAKPAPS